MDDLYTLLGRLDDQSVVLDLGCGHGSFHYETCRGRIVAMDLALPDKAARRPQAAYMLADSSSIPLSDGSVNTVVSHHTLEHFADYKTTLLEIRRVLNPHGWLWIAVPNGNGFDDALYRFLFDGGGHVNRFSYASLVAEVESATETRMIRSCDLFSSFIYLHRPSTDELRYYPPKARFLAEVPEGFRKFSVLALNAVTRLIDKAWGTRFSQYGWGFVFVKGQTQVGEMPSFFNVCRRCGSGDSAEAIKRGVCRSLLGLGVYDCPHCGEVNVFVSPPRDLTSAMNVVMKVKFVPAAIGLINVLILTATFHTWRFSYFWLDDFNVFYWIQRLDNSFGQMVWDCLNPFANVFRPLGMLVYWILWHMFGLNPLPYHLVAWAIHALNVVLLFVLLLRVVGSRYGAAVGALLFGFRANFADIYWSFGTIFELLALLLMLLAMLAYSSEMKFRWKLVTVAVLYLLAVKSKEMAITLPAVFLLYAICFNSERWTRKMAGLYAVLGIFGLAFGYSKLATMGSAARTAPYYMDISVLTLGRGFGWYFDHLYGTKIRWGAWIITSVLLLALFLYRRERRGLFFLGYVFITLLPVIFLVNHRYEFYWYIPFFGMSGLAAVLTGGIEKVLQARIPSNVLAPVAVIAFAFLSAGVYWRESRARGAVLQIETSAAIEFEALVAALRNVPSPEPGGAVYFNSLPKFLNPEALTSATQVVLRRTDVTVRITDVFPSPCRSCVSFDR